MNVIRIQNSESNKKERKKRKKKNNSKRNSPFLDFSFNLFFAAAVVVAVVVVSTTTVEEEEEVGTCPFSSDVPAFVKHCAKCLARRGAGP